MLIVLNVHVKKIDFFRNLFWLFTVSYLVPDTQDGEAVNFHISYFSLSVSSE